MNTMLNTGDLSDVKDVSSWEFDLFEQLGTKSKHWLIEPETNTRWLFKEGRENSGNDWAEVVVSKIATLLGIPHADYFLATENGKRGVITRSIVPDGGRLVHANELIVPQHSGDTASLRKVEHLASHKIRIIKALCNAIGKKPAGWHSLPEIGSAAAFFLWKISRMTFRLKRSP